MSQLRRALLYIALGYMLAFVTVPLMAMFAEAQTYAVATLAAYHFDRSKEYREFNPGLGLEHRYSNEFSVSAGFFRNSFDRHTNYLFAAYTPVELGGWRTGVIAGGVTGYEEGASPWFSGVAMRDFGSVGVNLVFATSGIALQIKLKVGH